MSRVIFTLLTVFFFTTPAISAPNFLVVEGQLLDASGLVPVESPSVSFNLKVYSPGVEACLLYQENHTLNMSNSQGLFSLSLGRGSQSGSDYEDINTLATALDNSTGPVTPTTCASGPNYTPNVSDSRLLEITYNDGSGPQTLSQDIEIGSSAYAMSAGSIDGLVSADLLKINSSGSYVLNQGNLENIFDSANHTELLALIAGTSTQYLSAAPSANVNANSQKIVNVGVPTAGTDATNKDYVDQNLGGSTVDTSTLSGLSGGDSGKVLQWDGTQWTSATAGGGNFFANGSVAMTGDLDMGANSLSNAANLNLAGDLTVGNNAILTGDLSISGGIGVAAGINSAGRVQLDTANELRFMDGANTNYVGFRAPSAVTTSVTWTLPVADGANGQVLTTDGAGILSWSSSSVSPNSITSAEINDDSIVNADIHVGAAIDASKLANGSVSNTEYQYLDGVTANLQPQLDTKLDNMGDAMYGSFTMENQNEVRFADSVNTKYVGFKAPATIAAAASFVWELPNDDGTAGQVLETNGSGILSWVNKTSVVGSALNSGSLWVGDASNEAAAVTLSGVATLSDTGILTLNASTIGSSELMDFSIQSVDLSDNSINSAKIVDNSVQNNDLADNIITINKLATANAPTSNQILEFDGANLNWVNPAGGDLIDGGNPGPIDVGSTDGDLNLLAIGIPQMTLDNTGNVGIGVGPTLPAQAKLEVRNEGAHTRSLVSNYGTNGSHSSFVGRKAEGNGPSPNAVATGRILASFAGEGYNGSGWGVGAKIVMSTTESWIGTLAHGTRMDFHTTPSGSGTSINSLSITDDGKVGIGINTPQDKMHVAGSIRADDSVFVSGTSSAATCTGPAEIGQIRWNNSFKVFEGCYLDSNNSSYNWVRLSKQCPTNYQWVGTPGSASAFCVGPQETADTYTNASSFCTSQTAPSGEIGSLCSAQQLQKYIATVGTLSVATMVSDTAYTAPNFLPVKVSDSTGVPEATIADTSAVTSEYRCCVD